jgi:hypothetical protein
MKEQTTQLPRQFSDLASFIAEWGELETQNERYLRRQTLPMERLTAYYDAVGPRLKSIFEHLDRFPFGAPLPAPEALLLRVVLAMTEVAQAVEVFGQPTVPFAPENHSVKIEVMRRV